MLAGSSFPSLSPWPSALSLLRRHFGRIVIGTILLLATYGVLRTVLPYHREQRVILKLAEHGAKIGFQTVGPTWIPIAIRQQIPVYVRAVHVNLDCQDIPADLLLELGSLEHLESLYLHSTPMNDAGLQAIQGLTRLQQLELTGTQITDTGVQALSSLTSLTTLSLSHTQVTAAGLKGLSRIPKLNYVELDGFNEEVRAQVRKDLPGCGVVPP